MRQAIPPRRESFNINLCCVSGKFGTRTGHMLAEVCRAASYFNQIKFPRESAPLNEGALSPTPSPPRSRVGGVVRPVCFLSGVLEIRGSSESSLS